MKRLFLLVLGVFFGVMDAQSYTEFSKLLYRLEQENKINHDTESYYDLNGKRFIYSEEFDDRTERWVLEINDKESRLIGLVNDKQMGKINSQIYTGDVVRRKHVVSLRFDKLEGYRLSIPLTYLHHITYQGGVWYLIDVNAGKRWVDINDLEKKREGSPSMKY